MKNIQNLFSESLKSLSSYTPIEPPDQIALRLGIPEHNLIKLDANENPFGISENVLSALSNGEYLHIYPDPAQVQLKQSISRYANCESNQIVAGAGADELIDIICRLCLEPGEKVVSFTPTFSYYSHVVTLNKAIWKIYSRNDDFSISLDAVKNIDLSSVKLVFLCSPNNPSGNLLEEEILDYFLSQDVIVLLDEAYFEFAQKSYVNKISDYNNLVILRTFSKCFGLAGLRVGYGIMSEELAEGLMRIKPPYSVNVAAEIALKTCLDNLVEFENQVNRIIQIRENTLNELNSFNQLQVFPSHSNFVLCKVLGYQAKKLHTKLEEKGILVRYFDSVELENYIRISIGTENQMRQFLKRLSDIID